MGLKVWLPLDGTIENKGLSGATATNTGATVDTSGKIGSCYRFQTNSNNITLDKKCCDLFADGDSFSYCCWIKIAAYPTVTQGSGSGGTVIYQTESSTVGGETVYGGGFGILINTSGVATGHANPFGGGKQLTIGTIPLNTWTHLALTYDKSTKVLSGYFNGELAATTTASTDWGANGRNFVFGKGSQGGWQNTMDNYQNDVRIYDNCLSKKEVKEISSGLILHYSLSDMEDHNTAYDSVSENLFRGTRMTEKDVEDFVSNSSTDWTKYIRYYNGSTSQYFFGGEDVRECTVTLSTAQNLGLCFVRSATDINLDSTSYYTISCEAKCSNKSRTLCIGLSYMNTSNTWTWRGGTNPKTFTANGTWQTFTHTFKPDADTKYICYCFTVKGAANSTDTFTIRKCKLEKGSANTGYTPAQQDIVELDTPFNTTSEADISGYGRTGTPTATLTFNTDTARYVDSTEFNGSKYIQVTSPSTEVRTISFWAKWNSIPSGQSVVFVDQKSKIGFGLMSTGILCSTNSVSSYTFPKTGIVANTWYHFAIVNTGASPTATTRDLYINGVKQTATSSTSNWTYANTLDYLQLGKRSTTSDGFAGKISDFRMYVTALSAEDIMDLYNAPAYIDNRGTMGAVEFVENTSNGESIGKTGVVGVKNFIEYSDNLKLMPDGSVFLKLLRHNNPTSKLFTSANCWLNTTDTDLYSSLVALKCVDWMRNLNQYEFLACEKLTSADTENQYRWKQTNNPATTNSATGYQSISGSASHMASGLATDGTHGCFDINGNNWWCCCGCYTPYTVDSQTGIPGFNGLVTTGYLELYIRIPDEMLKGYVDGDAKFFKQSINARQFKEI